MHWESGELWRRQIERRLTELGSLTKGNQQFSADRIADLIEQIDELRGELARVADRQDRMAEWIKTHLVRRSEVNGDDESGTGGGD